MPAGRPPMYKTPEEMQEVIDRYFAVDAFVTVGEETYYRPTVSGLAIALGFTTEALRNYEEKDEFLGTIKRAKQKVENALELNLYGNSVTGTIFNLKNNFGWKDKSEQDITTNGKELNTWVINPVTTKKDASD